MTGNKIFYSVHEEFLWFVVFCVVILFIYFNAQLKSAFFSATRRCDVSGTSCDAHRPHQHGKWSPKRTPLATL